MSLARNVSAVPNIVKDYNGTTYKKGRLLGKGGFARCYQFRDIATQHVYAAKIISKASFINSRDHKKIGLEIHLQRKLKHPNIVDLFYSFEDRENVYIMLELCSRQSLMELHKRRGAITPPEVRYFMKQIVAGVAFIHKCDIIHRDLKIGNIFLNEELMVKIGDFGLATPVLSHVERNLTFCGTPNYMAPEILLKQGHSFEVDIWALGCILYTLLIGKPPFETGSIEETYGKIRKNIYEIPPTVHRSAAELITRLLSAQPASRPQVTKILEFSFFSGFIPNSLPLSCLTMPPQFDSVRRSCQSRASTRSISDDDFSQKLLPGESSVEKRRLELKNSVQVLVNMTRYILLSRAPERQFESEDDAEAPECMPMIWVSSWVDYSNRYGVAYTFCDNSTGVLFNDQTRLLLDEPCVNMQYIENNTEMNVVLGSKPLKEKLRKKLILLRSFRAYMNNNLQKAGKTPTESDEIARLPSVCYCARRNDVILFQLTNGAVQINFMTDHVKIVLCPYLRAITLIEERGEMHTYKMGEIVKLGYPSMLRRQLKVCLEMLLPLRSLKLTDNVINMVRA